MSSFLSSLGLSIKSKANASSASNSQSNSNNGSEDNLDKPEYLTSSTKERLISASSLKTICQIPDHLIGIVPTSSDSKKLQISNAQCFQACRTEWISSNLMDLFVNVGLVCGILNQLNNTSLEKRNAQRRKSQKQNSGESMLGPGNVQYLWSYVSPATLSPDSSSSNNGSTTGNPSMSNASMFSSSSGGSGSSLNLNSSANNSSSAAGISAVGGSSNSANSASVLSVTTPSKVGANQYMDYMLTSVETIMDDEKFFPFTSTGATIGFGDGSSKPTSTNTRLLSAHVQAITVYHTTLILLQFLRVLAYAYHVHFSSMKQLKLDGCLDALLGHCIWFGRGVGCIPKPGHGKNSSKKSLLSGEFGWFYRDGINVLVESRVDFEDDADNA